MKKILVRADDLGYSEAVNYGIAKSVNDGIISSVGIMTNMPAIQHGLNCLKKADICLGLHTNICIGKPLCNPQLIPSIVQANGEFKTSKDYRNAKEDFVVFDEVILEIEAQLKKFIELTGKLPDYFEAHAVFSNNFIKGLEYIADKYRLKYSPITMGEPIIVGHTKVYMRMDSIKPDYDPIVSLKDMVENAHEDGCDVMVCHPGYLDSYILKTSSLTLPRPLEVEMACDEEIKQWLKQQKDVQLVTYRDL